MLKVKLTQNEYEDLVEKATAFDHLVSPSDWVDDIFWYRDIAIMSLKALGRFESQYFDKGFASAQSDVDSLIKRIKELENELLEERQKRLVLAGIVKENKG